MIRQTLPSWVCLQNLNLISALTKEFILCINAGVMSLLYQMIIGPLEIFFEVIYQLSYGILGNAGLAVIPVSLVINLLCLPLYLRADAIQKGNREKENSMAPYIDHIKKHFSGAEQYMMLQTYYRIENYKPLHVLRNAFSLLIQIPFFIAAYNFLSNLEIMQGTPLGPISDLSKPDSLLVIGGLSINILPILMTVVNILSGAVYSKKMSVQDKVQLYGVAIFFLILLYQSPAGLVFYWLLNNIFSLLKNIVISSISVSNFVKKIKNCQPFFKKVNKYLLFALFLIGCLMLLTGIVFLKLSGELNIKLISIGLLLQLPIIFNFVVKRLKKNNVLENDRAIFVTTCLFMVLLTGVLIPSAVISSSPTEFITISDYQSPLYHIFNSFLLALGTFVFWPSVFYYFSNSKVRQVFEFVLICISGLAIINYMVFETNLGVLSPVLQYKVQPNFSPFLTNINISICLVTTLILLVLYIKKINFVKILFRIMLLV
ncbi:membrane protein insertase YidC, partial [bacterium]|nr:membrane protein insertase YidC [bacterium]